jgi:hypothetical protein
MAHINHPGTPTGPDEHSHVHPGGEVHGHGVRDASVAVHHEVTDIPLGGVTRAAGFTVVFVGLVMLLMWGAWGFFLNQAKQLDPGKPPMSAEDYGQRLPPTPRIQSVPTVDLAAYRAEQAAKLNGLAWVDQGAGEVRVPINAAMRLIVSRADSFADQHAKTPEDHSWAFPGAAHMDTATPPAAPGPAAPGADPAHGEHAPATSGTATTPAAAAPATPHQPPQH